MQDRPMYVTGLHFKRELNTSCPTDFSEFSKRIRNFSALPHTVFRRGWGLKSEAIFDYEFALSENTKRIFITASKNPPGLEPGFLS
ncbi:MAG: hypothetical protein L6Q29_02985 [Candidatus Pacebacteria bacterium]|nr:hypothetical protein [Candidatus Paceibacterota bacterium]